MVILAFGAPDQTGTCRLTFPRKMPIEEQRQLFNAFKTSEEINQRVDALFSSLKSSFYIKGPIENMNLKSISEILLTREANMRQRAQRGKTRWKRSGLNEEVMVKPWPTKKIHMVQPQPAICLIFA